MGLDIRLPIGMMFTLLGLLLGGYGLLTGCSHELYASSLGININLVWGAVLLGFGLIMLGFAVRTARSRSSQTGE